MTEPEKALSWVEISLATDFVARYADWSIEYQFYKGEFMPVITVAIHPIDQEQKKHLIKELTEAAVKVTNVPADKYVVFIDEYENDAIGLAGKTRSEIISSASL